MQGLAVCRSAEPLLRPGPPGGQGRTLLTSLLPPDCDDSADETATSALGSVELGTVLDQLSELDRLLFTLRYDEGYTSAELSRLFELPPGTVRRRLSQTRHLLKTNLTED